MIEYTYRWGFVLGFIAGCIVSGVVFNYVIEKYNKKTSDAIDFWTRDTRSKKTPEFIKKNIKEELKLK